MNECQGDTCGEHGHDHDHSPDCGHIGIRLGDETAYLHNGHLHIKCGDHTHCRVIEFSADNPDGCNQVECDAGHEHGSACGHQQVPHGDHVDYLVNGRLHHVCDGHCDDHGPVEIVDK